MYPTVGRIVHYHTESKTPLPTAEPLAAMIVRVIGLPDMHSHKHPCTERCAVVNLCVYTQDAGTRLEVSVPWSPEPAPHHWCWPPKGA